MMEKEKHSHRRRLPLFLSVFLFHSGFLLERRRMFALVWRRRRWRDEGHHQAQLVIVVDTFTVTFTRLADGMME